MADQYVDFHFDAAEAALGQAPTSAPLPECVGVNEGLVNYWYPRIPRASASDPHYEAGIRAMASLSPVNAARLCALLRVRAEEQQKVVEAAVEAAKAEPSKFPGGSPPTQWLVDQLRKVGPVPRSPEVAELVRRLPVGLANSPITKTTGGLSVTPAGGGQYTEPQDISRYLAQAMGAPELAIFVRLVNHELGRIGMMDGMKVGDGYIDADDPEMIKRVKKNLPALNRPGLTYSIPGSSVNWATFRPLAAAAYVKDFFSGRPFEYNPDPYAPPAPTEGSGVSHIDAWGKFYAYGIIARELEAWNALSRFPILSTVQFDKADDETKRQFPRENPIWWYNDRFFGTMITKARIQEHYCWLNEGLTIATLMRDYGLSYVDSKRESTAASDACKLESKEVRRGRAMQGITMVVMIVSEIAIGILTANPLLLASAAKRTAKGLALKKRLEQAPLMRTPEGWVTPVEFAVAEKEAKEKEKMKQWLIPAAVGVGLLGLILLLGRK